MASWPNPAWDWFLCGLWAKMVFTFLRSYKQNKAKQEEFVAETISGLQNLKDLLSDPLEKMFADSSCFLSYI